MKMFRIAGLLSTLAAAGLVVACQPSPQMQSQAQPPAQQAPPLATTAYPIYFPTNSTAIHTNDLETIRGVASMLASNPALTATIVGATDTTGTMTHNAQLSQRRAEAVYDALVKTNKVPSSRITTRAVGEERLAVPTPDDKPELLNRTVYIVVR